MPDENKGLTTIENGGAPTTEIKPIRVESNDEGLCAAASTVNLPDSVLNKLYHSYSIKQRRAALIWFLFASIFFDIWSFVIPHEQCIEALGKSHKYIKVDAYIDLAYCLYLHLIFKNGVSTFCIFCLFYSKIYQIEVMIIY